MAQETLARRIESNSAASAGRMSFEEFLSWANENTHAEWVDGEVVWMSPATDPHQDLANFLSALFRHFVEARGAGWVRSNPFLMRLPSRPSGREPDLVYVAQENRARVKRTYLDGPADLVVEIISPESDERDRVTKLAEYESGGVREYWLLDRDNEQSKFYQLDENGKYQQAVVGFDGIYHSVAADGLWLRVAWLWQPPRLVDVLREWKLI